MLLACSDIGIQSNRSPLIAACRSGHAGVVQRLLSRRPLLVTQMQGGWGALHTATQHSQEEVVMVLLKHQVPVDMVTESGWTALHLAAQIGNFCIAKALL